MKRNDIIRIAIISSYVIFLAISWVSGFGPGRESRQNFACFSLDMLKVLPFALVPSMLASHSGRSFLFIKL